MTVLISDLHFGVGRRADGSWHPTEDFRWSKALQGFLDKISEDGQEKADLIIVGDFLELWQPATQCVGKGADLGCTIQEMAALTKLVAAQHSTDLSALRKFAERGENRLHLIVGNHDSTLRYAEVWEPVGSALNAASGRIELVTDGVWQSADGRIVAEHGHQIGQDVNKYETWPDIARGIGDRAYIVRPWGELFVQRLFNEQEAQYPIIDNLSPETAGARIRAADRGFWGSAADVAKLLVFNVLETSLKQKQASLGEPPKGPITWNVEYARTLGASLVLSSLPSDDPLQVELAKNDSAAQEILKVLAEVVQDQSRLPDEEIQHICDLIAEKKPRKEWCWDPKLGALAQNLLVSEEKLLAKHLEARLPNHKAMEVFIYGHTHHSKKPWNVKLDNLDIEFTVANTGAFQRLIDEAGFQARRKGRSEVEALKTMTLDELPACYSAILISPSGPNKLLKPQLKAWHMAEDGEGEFMTPESCQTAGVAR